MFAVTGVSMRTVRSIVVAAQAVTTRLRHWAASTWRNPAVRERALACATFAAIFAATIGSVDYIITGGPSWNPGGEAYAYEAPRPRAEPPAPTFVGYAPPPPPVYAEDYAIFEYAAMSPDALLGGPISGGLQNAAYTISPPRLVNSRPSYQSSDPYAGRVLRDEDIVLTQEVSTTKQAF